jgi:uncharacterized protein with NRDE domain
MCLIAFAWRAHPRYRLVVAANRDEFHARKTAAAGFWQDAPGVLAGRDLERGGTWLGVTRAGRFAALSNYRDQEQADPAKPSRGTLPAQFLTHAESTLAYARRVDGDKHAYPGFNLLLGDGERFYYITNRGLGTGAVTQGVHAVSNGLLDESWPKVKRVRGRMRELLDAQSVNPDDLLEMLGDTREALPSALPETGLDASTERFLSPVFIRGETYGTRASTVVLMDEEKIIFVERRFGPNGRHPETQREQFAIAGGAES